MKKYLTTFSAIALIISFSYHSFHQDAIKAVETQKISKKKLLGQINPSKDADFSIITAPYTLKKNLYLNTEALQAYQDMYRAAANDGIDLKIVSAFRSFYRQKVIWESKWTGERKVMGQNLYITYPNAEKRAKVILMFSSMPGTSRHHWGTDVDIYSLNDKDFLSGKGKKIYDWLQKHAEKYGFCQVYTPKPETRTTGYEEEKWHWSYQAVATEYLEQYQKHIKYSDIVGFKGDRVAKNIGVIENYVLGINPNCKKSKYR